MGAARGLDEGIIGTTVVQPSFVSDFGLHDKSLDAEARANRLSNITSMVQLGSIGGALIAFWVNDRIGRIRATQELCLVWMVGTMIYLYVNLLIFLSTQRYIASKLILIPQNICRPSGATLRRSTDNGLWHWPNRCRCPDLPR